MEKEQLLKQLNDLWLAAKNAQLKYDEHAYLQQCYQNLLSLVNDSDKHVIQSDTKSDN